MKMMLLLRLKSQMLYVSRPDIGIDPKDLDPNHRLLTIWLVALGSREIGAMQAYTAQEFLDGNTYLPVISVPEKLMLIC